ncbi:unnamed protein product [Calypogeia fissa]
MQATSLKEYIHADLSWQNVWNSIEDQEAFCVRGGKESMDVISLESWQEEDPVNAALDDILLEIVSSLSAIV